MAARSTQADPRVSVIVCLRNEEQHVEALLGRLERMQTPGSDVVLVDDQSDDGTGAALRAGAGRVPDITVLTGPGRGVAAARNLAVEHARGDFVWFGDADDDWDPAITAELVRGAVAAGADVAVCNARKDVDGQLGEPISDAPHDEVVDRAELFSRLLDGRVQGHLWNKVFRRSVLGTSPFPPTRAHSDLGGLLGLAPRVTTAAFVPAELYRYRVRAGTILNSSGYRWEDLYDCEAIARGSAAALGWAADDRRLTYFSLAQVTLPLINESVRRERSTDPEQLAQVRARCRRGITVRGLVELARQSRWLAAVRAAAFKALPRLYCAVYRRYRLRRWGSVDAAIRRPPPSR